MTSRSAMLGRDVFWLLDIELSDRTLRFADGLQASTDSLEITDANGDTLVYRAGLGGVEISAQLDDAPSGRAVAITIGAVPRPSWAEMRARGLRFDTGTAVLRRWFEGQTLEEADVELRGYVAEPEFGGDAEDFTFTLRQHLWDETAEVPDPASVVDDTTYPPRSSYSIDETIYGAHPPLIFGRPGYVGIVDGSAAPITPGSPALLVEYSISASLYYYSRLVIAGHRVHASSVRVYDLTDGVSEQRTVHHTADKLGRTIAYVDFDGASSIVPRLGHEYWVAFGTTGGGLLDDTGAGDRRGLGEVLEWLLRQTGKPVSPSMAGHADRLNRYLVDAWVGEPTRTEVWIQQHIAPVFPVRYAERDGGALWVLMDYSQTKEDAVGHIDVDLQGDRISPLFEVPDDRYNRFTLRYAPTKGQTLLKQRTLTDRRPTAAETGGNEDARLFGNYLCRESQHHYGRTLDWSESSFVVSDDATAMLVLRAKARRHTFPRHAFIYEGAPEHERYHLGDALLVSCDDLELSERLAFVTGRRIGGGPPRLQLELADDLGRMSRSTT